jgi:hypothetical protein
MQKIAEIIEASTTEFAAECYELYSLPPLGSLVKTADGETELYGVVYNASTSSVEPGRRPIARGRNEESEEAIYRANPQLAKLLRSEFRSIVVGHRQGAAIRHFLPPGPARIHGFVHVCAAEEVREFSKSLDFLSVLLNVRLSVPGEEVVGAALRQMSLAQEDPRRFLVAAGKELAVMLGDDFSRLRVVLARLKGASV